MLGIEVILGVLASGVTIASSLGWVLDRNGKRIDARFESVEKKFDTVIEIVTEMRAQLPLQYTLREDHIRLTERVETLQTEVAIWRHKERPNGL
jgi:hypothetical protein